MARKPPLRNKNLTLYFSVDEMLAIVGAAREEGVSVSVWCQRALLRASGAGENGECEHGVKTGDFCVECSFLSGKGQG